MPSDQGVTTAKLGSDSSSRMTIGSSEATTPRSAFSKSAPFSNSAPIVGPFWWLTSCSSVGGPGPRGHHPTWMNLAGLSPWGDPGHGAEDPWRMTQQAAVEGAGRPARGRLISMLDGIRPYQRSWLRTDIIAGITLAALAIPDGRGYTKIAGLPVITGLYPILLPIAAFALLGSSRHLVVGADSATAAIMFAGIASLGI